MQTPSLPALPAHALPWAHNPIIPPVLVHPAARRSTKAQGGRLDACLAPPHAFLAALGGGAAGLGDVPGGRLGAQAEGVACGGRPRKGRTGSERHRVSSEQAPMGPISPTLLVISRVKKAS